MAKSSDSEKIYYIDKAMPLRLSPLLEVQVYAR